MGPIRLSEWYQDYIAKLANMWNHVRIKSV